MEHLLLIVPSQIIMLERKDGLLVVYPFKNDWFLNRHISRTCYAILLFYSTPKG
jgi:hypothetical protein